MNVLKNSVDCSLGIEKIGDRWNFFEFSKILNISKPEGFLQNIKPIVLDQNNVLYLQVSYCPFILPHPVAELLEVLS